MSETEELLFTKEHEWVRVEGRRATVGITDHAQASLGDITFVELPAKGKTVAQFDVMGTIESVKAASDLYAPLSGTVVEVNETLADEPEKINRAPRGEGWIAVLEISDEKEKENLLTATQYEEYLKTL